MDVFNHIVCAFLYIYNVLDIYGQGALVCEEKSRHIVIPFKLAWIRSKLLIQQKSLWHVIVSQPKPGNKTFNLPAAGCNFLNHS